MKRTLVFTLLAMAGSGALATTLAATAAQAADVTAPVKEIMTEAQNGWSENPVGEPRDYFDEERLKRIYSQDFARVYTDATRFPAFEDGDSPLDYDPIVSGQDSCSLKDVKIVPAAPEGARADVAVTFDNISCLEDPGERKPAELHFIVVEENGKPVIDDILRGGEQGSLKAELVAIAAQGAQ
ncbi:MULTISPECIES: hypothetical protein [unclassified Rhizobium]|uniref:hypothetical protein n=1 Tax=unclassified Rhizobium TaxID=2613769 RepID=UPI0009E8F2C6|nr:MULTISPECIES: hypothetical protein [unclassified Rhizobium]TCM58922.1 hypothetical protein C8J36_101831 [Rhizobium sp. PP-F2F-G48]